MRNYEPKQNKMKRSGIQNPGCQPSAIHTLADNSFATKYGATIVLRHLPYHTIPDGGEAGQRQSWIVHPRIRSVKNWLNLHDGIILVASKVEPEETEMRYADRTPICDLIFSAGSGIAH
jgi:hypothetical protein